MAAKTIKMRPYARLLAMLGDQLIRNERVALVELVKNSYDADATWATISFDGFDTTETPWPARPNATITIEDDGDGMTLETIEKHWARPASPDKKVRKQQAARTRKGRVMQGEKGIGRFAMLKLGRSITVVTRPDRSPDEFVITYDLSHYDDEFLQEDGVDKELYLDDVRITVEERKALAIVDKPWSVDGTHTRRPPHGTQITIAALSGQWSRSKVEGVHKDLARLQSIFSGMDRADDPLAITVDIKVNGDPLSYAEEDRQKLQRLLDECAPVVVRDGRYDEETQTVVCQVNGSRVELPLSAPEIAGQTAFRKRFVGSDGTVRSPQCGSFSFQFHVFDLSQDAKGRYLLDKEDRAVVKDHRIYLYRDDVRVYPYGEPEDDWLGLDTKRGTVSATRFLSNDQVVGYVSISQQRNPQLRDKTNREGLIDDEVGAVEDFITLIRTILTYIRKGPYERYRQGLKNKGAQDVFRTRKVSERFAALAAAVKGNRPLAELTRQAQKEYRQERDYLVQRAEVTEQLAGVGLSVESASHDIMVMMTQALKTLDGLIESCLRGACDVSALRGSLETMRGQLSFVSDQLRGMQAIFTSAKQRRRQIRVAESVASIRKVYHRSLDDAKVAIEVHSQGPPLVAKTTDAVLLQVLINLFDNAVYWLGLTPPEEQRQIRIELDGSRGRMIFADNGPGISPEDAPYIFEPFYSGKGEEGRGLGLYIARQLLDRHDYSIELADIAAERILSGANFVVSFVGDDSSDVR